MSTALETLLVSLPTICGGRLRIEGTRITVNQVVICYKQGYPPEENEKALSARDIELITACPISCWQVLCSSLAAKHLPHL